MVANFFSCKSLGRMRYVQSSRFSVRWLVGHTLKREF